MRRAVCLTKQGPDWKGTLDGHAFRIACEGATARDFAMYLDGFRIPAEPDATCAPFHVRFIGNLDGTPFAFALANESSCCPPISQSSSSEASSSESASSSAAPADNVGVSCGHCTTMPRQWTVSNTGTALDGTVLTHLSGGCAWRADVSMDCGGSNAFYDIVLNYDSVNNWWNLFFDWSFAGFPVASIDYRLNDADFACLGRNDMPNVGGGLTVGSCVFNATVTITPL